MVGIVMGLGLTGGVAHGGDTWFIQEYQVTGAHKLSRLRIEEAVYPHLGPERTAADVEKARAAIEAAYREQGIQTVSVQVAQPGEQRSVVVLQVDEMPVGRLRVQGARFTSPKRLKAMAPSLAEGSIINFHDVPGDIIAMNQSRDRRVTPSLRQGSEAGTVDVELNVEETYPVHGSLELNNRYSADTTRLRLNGSVSATNLWQRGHTGGLSFQISPEDLDEVKVFSGYYFLPVRTVPGLSLMAQAVRQDSSVSTLGGIAVAGRGNSVGLRAMLALPSLKGFTQSFSLGLDRKDFDQAVDLGTDGEGGADTIVTPTIQYPLTASYDAAWAREHTRTEFNASVTMHFRGYGSGIRATGLSRYRADGSFIYLRSDLSQTRDLFGGWQAFGRVQGQITSGPLLSAEQMSGGGLGTARGYLEAEASGDHGLFGSFELRLPRLVKSAGNDLQLYGFVEGGWLGLRDTLPEQDGDFYFLSWGVGTRFKWRERFHGSLDVALPEWHVSRTPANEPRLTFRAWAEY